MVSFFNIFLYTLSCVSLPGIRPQGVHAFHCVCVSMCVSVSEYLSTANLTYHWIYHPNLICAQLLLYAQGPNVFAVINIF